MIKHSTISTVLALILCFSCSKDENETPDITPPSVNFSIKGTTLNNAETPIIGNTIEIEIDAQDAKGISKVEAFMNDTKVGEDNQPPFKITIDLSSYAKKLSGKGTVISKTQTQYILKVSATDLAGNVASIERNIIVDNEMPIITEVSLENNTVIAGEENNITFKANDNKEISTLEVKINDAIVETSTLEDNTFTFNIDSSLLEDGINNMTITASDQASNTAIYNAPFVVDNSGPEITLEGLPSNDIIDEVILLTIGAEDPYSEVTSLKIFINDDLILSSDDVSELILNFNPDDYDTGDTTLRIDAIDALGNESTLETDFQIKRLLLKINVPNDFLAPSISKFYVFASKNSGELLDIKPLEFNTSIIRLNTLEDISPNTDYMINFAYLYSGIIAQSSTIKTIQNVKRSSLDRIDLKVPERKSISTHNTYQLSEMPNGTSIQGAGTDYNSTRDFQNIQNGYRIEEYNLAYTTATSNKYYIHYYNSLNNTYGYQLVNRPLASNFIIDYNNFITDGVETRYINDLAIQDPDKITYLTLYGYLTANDLEHDIKHLIWGLGFGNSMLMNGLRYDFNTNFHQYNYQLTMENYRVEAIGEPLEYYHVPDWSVDYSYSSNNKTFALNTSGTTHKVGKISMGLVDTNSNYTWTILFDSQNATEVKLPELPQELLSWNINNYYANGNLNIEQIEVKKYEGLDNYDEFLQSIIRNNEYNQHKVSEKTESIFKTNVGAYLSRPDFSFYY